MLTGPLSILPHSSANLFGHQEVDDSIEMGNYEFEMQKPWHYRGLALAGINTWIKAGYVIPRRVRVS